MRVEAVFVAFCIAMQVQAAPLEARGFSLCLPGALGSIVSGFQSTVSGFFSKWFSKRSDDLAYFQVQELLNELENTGLYEGFVSHYVANNPEFHKEFEGCLEHSMNSGDISLKDVYYSMEKKGLFEQFYEKHMKHTKPKLINLFRGDSLKHEVYDAKKTENHPHVNYKQDKAEAERKTMAKLLEYGIEESSEMYGYILERLQEAALTHEVTRSLVARDNGQETVDWLVNYMETHSADDVLKTIKNTNISDKLIDLAMTHPDYWSWALGGSSKKAKRGILGTVWNLFTGGSSSSSNSSSSSSSASVPAAATTSAGGSGGNGAADASSYSFITGAIISDSDFATAAAAAATGTATTSNAGSATVSVASSTSTVESAPPTGDGLVGTILSLLWDVVKGVVDGTADLSTPNTIGKIILLALRFVINLLGGGGSSSGGSTTVASTGAGSATATTSALAATATGSSNLTGSGVLGLISGLFKRDAVYGEGFGLVGDLIEELYVREVENGADLTKKSLDGFPKNRQDLEVFKREMADYFYENLINEFMKKVKF